jgi:tRNA(Ile2) C34 agmatinyltransferase TiaS
VDDTDRLDGPGTGHRARELGAVLESAQLGQLLSITRHQLLERHDIRYTSHNSAVCLLIEADVDCSARMATASWSFLQHHSAPGANTGFCVIAEAAVDRALREFGQMAKREVLAKAHALALAEQMNIWLEEVTGDGGGVIGALAAVGLRAGGNDGHFLWLPGLRELNGIFTQQQLMEIGGIDIITDKDGNVVSTNAKIQISGWAGPIL